MATVIKTLRSWMNTEVRIIQVIPAYLILAVGAVLSAYQFDQISNQRLEDLNREQAAITELQCDARVNTRESLRTVLLAITAEFNPSDTTDRIVELIESEYPSLDPASCLGEATATPFPVEDGTS